ncbi:MAG: ATP-binding protein [Bacteroidia bacterium]
MLLKRFYLLCFILANSSLLFSINLDSLRSAERLAPTPDVRFEINLQLLESFLETNLDSTQKYFEKSKALITANPSDVKWGKHLSLLAKNLTFNGHIDSALIVLQAARTHAEKALDADALLADTYFLEAYMRIQLGELASAKQNIDQGFSIIGADSEADDAAKALARLRLHSAYGFYYQHKGEFTKALAHYLQAESISTRYRLPSNNTVASIPNNIALIYLDQEDFELAFEYFQKSVEIAKKRKLSPGVLALYQGNVGVAYNRLGQYEEANPLLTMALESYQHSQHATGQMLMLNEFALQYQKKNNIAKSDSFLSLIEPLMADVSPNKFYLESLIMMGQNNLSSNRIELATKFADKAYTLAKKIKNLKSLVRVTELQKNLSYQKQDIQQAYQYQEEYLLYSDSLINLQNIRKLESMRFNSTIKQQAIENNSLRQQQEIQAKLIKQQQIIISMIVIGLLLTLIFIILRLKLHREQKLIQRNLERRTEALQIAKLEAEEATRSKAEFLSIMSHEIRTPMNAVVGMTHLLLDENPKPCQVEYLKTLQFSGNNLLTLINDILDFSKISAGKMELEHIAFNLQELSKGIVQTIGVRASDKGIEIRHEYAEDLNAYYMGDPVRIGQILTNLLGNAVKFTEKGMVSLRISQGAEANIFFEVIDTGIGIPAEKQAVIFEQFSQSNVDITRNYGGTGLGLSITKNLLELMDSSIKLKSTEGEGSNFYFHLKLEEGKIKRSTQSAKPLSAIENIGSLKGIRVLLAEDNRINQIVCGKFLQKWDIEYEVANDGREVLELLEKSDYNLILMDIQMPDMDGIEATRKIRSSEQKAYQNIPIIALTASILDESMQSIQEVGMSDLIGKPFDPTLLFQKIRHYSLGDS